MTFHAVPRSTCFTRIKGLSALTKLANLRGGGVTFAEIDAIVDELAAPQMPIKITRGSGRIECTESTFAETHDRRDPHSAGSALRARRTADVMGNAPSSAYYKGNPADLAIARADTRRLA